MAINNYKHNLNEPVVLNDVNITGRVGVGTAPRYSMDVVGDINSSTAIRVKGVDVLDEALRLSIALG